MQTDFKEGFALDSACIVPHCQETEGRGTFILNLTPRVRLTELRESRLQVFPTRKVGLRSAAAAGTPPSPRQPPDPLPSLRRISGRSATWRRPGPGRDGGRPRAPGTRERRETQRPGSPPTQIPSASGPTPAPPGLPGASGEPLPLGQRRRRYLPISLTSLYLDLPLYLEPSRFSFIPRSLPAPTLPFHFPR